MAGAIGSSAGGYATVQPTENYIGQALQNVEQNAFKYREEQRDEEAKAAALAKAQKDALAKQAEQDLDDSDKINAIRAKDSGISGIDSAVVNGMSDQRKKWIEATQNYRKTGDKRYLIERSSAMNNLNAIANIPEGYRKATEGIYEGVRNGTLDRSEEKRITELGEKLEKGFIVPKIENGVMSFDVFERDPNTGQLSSISIKNRKGEDIISDLTPKKKFDYNKHIGEVQNLAGNATTSVVNGIETTGYPNAAKFASTQANQLFTDQNLLHDVAQKYGIEEGDKGEYSPEDKKNIYNRYYNDVVSGLNTGTRRDYEAERVQLAREEAARARAKASQDKKKTFTPPVNVVKTGGKSTNLGMNIVKGEKILVPTYEKGKHGSVKGVVLRDDGSYSFSIATRKDDSLNAEGLANKKAFESKPENTGEEYSPVDSDYVYSTAKPTEFNSNKNLDVIQPYVREMINPRTAEYFQNFDEYKEVYDPYKSKRKTTVVKTPAKTVVKSSAPAKKQSSFNADDFYKNYKSKK